MPHDLLGYSNAASDLSSPKPSCSGLDNLVMCSLKTRKDTNFSLEGPPRGATGNVLAFDAENIHLQHGDHICQLSMIYIGLWPTLTSQVACCLQGLAPHHDDVDIFVCQTEGSKRWRLYNPRKGFALPAQPSGDLPEDTLGDPVMDVTLQVRMLHCISLHMSALPQLSCNSECRHLTVRSRISIEYHTFCSSLYS